MNKNIYSRILILSLLFTFFFQENHAQLVLTNGAPSATVDFSSGMQSTVGNGYFRGLGFSPSPAAGQLNSNAWAIVNGGSTDLLFGGSQTSGSYALGATSLAVTTGGVYAYTGSPASVTNPTLMIQGSGAAFGTGSPAPITLRVLNSGSTIITQIVLSYNLYIRNDQTRSSSFNFSWSVNDTAYTNVPTLNYSSPATADAAGWVSAGSRSTTITGLNIPPGGYAYLRWTVDDTGSGSRDEVGLDDINVAATYTTPCTPPSIQALIPTFTNVLSSQMDVTFTRGNGTGGVIIIASTLPTLSSNPVSGTIYAGNSNFGNGGAIGGGFVVYRGPGSGTLATASFTVSGLSPSTTYYFYLFEYDVTVPCYTTTPAKGNKATASGSTTSATDYFRSRISGNWNNASNWESSASAGGPWVTATLKPTLSASGITILSTHTISLSADETAKKLIIAAGGTLTYLNTTAGGYNLNIADATGVDFEVDGTFLLYGIQPTLASGATAEIVSGGLVRANANNGGAPSGSTSDDFARLSTVLFRTNSVFEWNLTTPFETTLRIYFPAAGPEIATFKISQNISGILGSNSYTIINGLLEANGNASFSNTGDKTFRNGIIGTGTLNLNSACEFIIDGTTAQLGGTGAINLNAGGRLRVASGSATTLISNKTINAGPITVDGSLYTGSAAPSFIISGTASFGLSAAGNIYIGSTDGITASSGLGNIQVSGTRVYDNGGDYIYYSAGGSQSTGDGLPAIITGFLTVSNTSAVGNNTVTLLLNNTTVSAFNLAAGLFAAGGGQNLKIATGGIVTATGANQITGALAGIIYFTGAGVINTSVTTLLTNVELHGPVNMGGSNVQIRGTLNIGVGGSVTIGSAPYYAYYSILLYSCSCNFPAGQEWYQNKFGNVAGVPYHVTLAPGTSLNFQNDSTREMRGDLNINTGSTFTLSTLTASDLNIMGNWTRAAGAFFVPNGRVVRFNGVLGNQWITVTGSGTETFAYIYVDKVISQSLMQASSPDATDVSVIGGSGGTALELINGNLDINGHVFTFRSFNGTGQNDIGIDGAAGNLTRFVTSTGGSGTFRVQNTDAAAHVATVSRLSANAALLGFGSTVIVITEGVSSGKGGLNFGNTISTVNGTLQINPLGYVTGFAPTYGTGSFLKYNPAGAFDRNVEWSAISGPGYPYNVTVQNNTNLTLNTVINGNTDLAMAANLTITSGASLSLGSFANTVKVGGNIQIDGGLTLATLNGGDIYIAGNWNRGTAGTFTPNDRAVFFNGPAASTITANGNGQLFSSLYLSKNLPSNTLTLLDSISVAKEFAISSGLFQLTNKNVTLLSNSTGTASFGKLVSGDVTYTSGRFIVQRYIPTGTHGKSWQFLAVPDNGGQTINAAWQEGHVLPVTGINNFGTIISSNVSGAGFDIIGGVGPSMKTFNPTGTNSWTGVPNTTSAALYDKRGYMILVRGDRNASAYNSPATPTTLRTTGKLFVPISNPPPATTILAGKFASIGNPYACAIDFKQLTFDAAPAIDSVYYVWDPLLGGAYNLGAYQTISSVTNYKPTPGGTANYNSAVSYTQIQSGQAFLMHASGSGGTVSFTENAKVSGSKMVYRHAEPDQRKSLRAQLSGVNSDAEIQDGNIVVFDHNFSNEYDGSDALKLSNASENFGISSNQNILSVEARNLVLSSDTIHYSLKNLHVAQYKFGFFPENMNEPQLTAYLEDRFLQTKTTVSLSDSSYITFDITSDPLSAVADRFILVFNRNQHGTPGTITPANLLQADSLITSNPGISVYPNPVVDKAIHISFHNKLSGDYTIQVFNNTNQLVRQENFAISNNHVNIFLRVPNLASGYYLLSISAPDGSKSVQSLFVK